MTKKRKTTTPINEQTKIHVWFQILFTHMKKKIKRKQKGKKGKICDDFVVFEMNGRKRLENACINYV